MDDDIRNLFEDPAFEAYVAQSDERKFNVFDVLRYADYEIGASGFCVGG